MLDAVVQHRTTLHTGARRAIDRTTSYAAGPSGPPGGREHPGTGRETTGFLFYFSFFFGFHDRLRPGSGG